MQGLATATGIQINMWRSSDVSELSSTTECEIDWGDTAPQAYIVSDNLSLAFCNKYFFSG